MGFNSTLYGSGNKPHFISYSGGSTYTTQTYCEPPQWKLANNMTTEFGAAISGATKPVATFDGQVFNGFADGLWIYRLYKDGDLVATYQFQDQVFCIPAVFDRVEAVCMSIGLTPSVAVATDNPSTPVPTPAGVLILLGAALIRKRRSNLGAL